MTSIRSTATLLVISALVCVTMAGVLDFNSAYAQTNNSANNGLTDYVNKDYNFSIKYPQNWQVNENPTNPQAIVQFTDPQGSSAININEKKYDLSQNSLKVLADSSFNIIQKVVSANLLEEGSFTVNGQDAYFIEYRFSSSNTSLITKIFMVAVDSNDVFVMTCVTASSPYEAQLNQFNDVVSSFQFTGTTTNQPSSPSSPVSNPSQSTPSTIQSQIQIPTWIRNNAKWWSQGQLGDSDFTKGIQYLIQKGIMHVPTQSGSSTTSGTPGIPAWIKKNAGWWAAGQISDGDFVKGIQWLVSNGIVNPSATTQPPQSSQEQSQPQQTTEQSTPTLSAGNWEIMQQAICYQKGGCNVGTTAFDTLDIHDDGTWTFGSTSGKWSVSSTTMDDVKQWGYAMAYPDQVMTRNPYKITLDGWNGASASGPLDLASDGKVNFVWVIYPYDKSSIGPALIVMKFYLRSQTG